jgi:hypothetical protein
MEALRNEGGLIIVLRLRFPSPRIRTEQGVGSGKGCRQLFTMNLQYMNHIGCNKVEESKYVHTLNRTICVRYLNLAALIVECRKWQTDV